jgi:hypothetical protein
MMPGRLQKMFSEYGEVTNSKTLAAAIVTAGRFNHSKPSAIYWQCWRH